jgi:hypothetical protein
MLDIMHNTVGKAKRNENVSDCLFFVFLQCSADRYSGKRLDESVEKSDILRCFEGTKYLYGSAETSFSSL